MKILTCEQRSVEWFEARKGVPTASQFDKIVTIKGEQSKQRTKYLHGLAGELLGGIVEEGYQSAAMMRGNELEAEARAFYELINEPVHTVGFCLSDGIGCSPDGLVGDSGLLEIKCPLISTHVEYLLKNELPSDYFQQTQGQLLVTGREWVDFISYYPGLKPLVIRVTRNEEFLGKLKAELKLFCAELEETVRKLA